MLTISTPYSYVMQLVLHYHVTQDRDHLNLFIHKHLSPIKGLAGKMLQEKMVKIFAKWSLCHICKKKGVEFNDDSKRRESENDDSDMIPTPEKKL